ncbi:uncharacterized protein IL334_007520 [Kwoniella shivajii]|uniref:Amine oxidase domain-containing protein n=1 Tax=Kwoniella shivajii TaxID=564305 RepID=A0ABZ1D8W7_9TREE|nr:hypothetical protein IL334_007520 [Kwoniella shivajii]
MKVAVIGSGLAGLTTAYLLRQQGIEVWLIEKSSKLGFHSESVSIPLDSLKDEVEKYSRRGKGTNEKDVDGHKEKWIVDVPMRGFQGGYYPLLLSLYHHLGIPLASTNYTFSFSSNTSTYFIHSGSSGWSIPSLPSIAFTNLFTLLRDITTFLGVAFCYLLLVTLSFMAWHDILPSCVSSPDSTLREFTTQLSIFLSKPLTIPIIDYTPWTPLGDTFEFFIGKIVLPLFSAVGTMTSADVWSMPVRIMLEYIHTTLGTNHYHLSRGFSAADVANLLIKPVESQGQEYVKLGTEIIGLTYNLNGGVSVGMRNGDNEPERVEIIVDKVILATQASVAKKLLEGLEESLKFAREEKEKRRVGEMRAALGKVSYRETIVVTHRDTSILPSPRDRRDLNFFSPSSSSSSQHIQPSDDLIPYFPPTGDRLYTQTTQIIRPPKRKWRRRSSCMILQTTNPVVPIDPRRVLSVSKLERALPLRQPNQILPYLRNPSPSACVYIVGSYAYPGIPLLEGCVGSAKLAVERILANDPAHMSKISGIDWDHGRGNWVARAWRWRWHKSIWG